MKKNLIFIGYPGSGKGTLAKLLNNYTQISTGDLLRKEIATGSDLGKEIASVINSGNLVSDEMALNLIKNNVTSGENYIFDGYPRTLTQAISLQPLIEDSFLAIHFKINKQDLVDRIVNRRSCQKCGAIYNLKSKPPVRQNTCDICDFHGLTHRVDDTAEVLEKRLLVYEKEADSLLNYYKERNALVVLSANKSTTELHSFILSLMEKFTK